MIDLTNLLDFFAMSMICFDGLNQNGHVFFSD